MQHDKKNILNIWHLTLNQSKIRETSSPWTLCQKGKCLQNDAFLPPSMYTYTVYFIFPVLSSKHFQVHRPERRAGDLFCCCRPLRLCFMGHSSNLPAFVRKPIDQSHDLYLPKSMNIAPNSEPVWTSNWPWSFLGRLDLQIDVFVVEPWYQSTTLPSNTGPHSPRSNAPEQPQRTYRPHAVTVWPSLFRVCLSPLRFLRSSWVASRSCSRFPVCRGFRCRDLHKSA